MFLSSECAISQRRVLLFDVCSGSNLLVSKTMKEFPIKRVCVVSVYRSKDKIPRVLGAPCSPALFHYLNCLCFWESWGEFKAPSWYWARGRVQPGQVASISQEPTYREQTCKLHPETPRPTWDSNPGTGRRRFLDWSTLHEMSLTILFPFERRVLKLNEKAFNFLKGCLPATSEVQVHWMWPIFGGHWRRHSPNAAQHCPIWQRECRRSNKLLGRQMQYQHIAYWGEIQEGQITSAPLTPSPGKMGGTKSQDKNQCMPLLCLPFLYMVARWCGGLHRYLTARRFPVRILIWLPCLWSLYVLMCGVSPVTLASSHSQKTCRPGFGCQL